MLAMSAGGEWGGRIVLFVILDLAVTPVAAALPGTIGALLVTGGASRGARWLVCAEALVALFVVAGALAPL